jgi:hypothetical protein
MSSGQERGFSRKALALLLVLFLTVLTALMIKVVTDLALGADPFEYRLSLKNGLSKTHRGLDHPTNAHLAGVVPEQDSSRPRTPPSSGRLQGGR